MIGTLDAATDDYRLAAGSPCFTGISQGPSLGAGPDVVYRFTAPVAGDYYFRVHGQLGNHVIYVAAAAPVGAPPQDVACTTASNRAPTNQFSSEEVGATLAAAQQVLVFIDTGGTDPAGQFRLNVDRPAPDLEPDSFDNPEVPACGSYVSFGPAGKGDTYTLGSPPAGSRVFATLDGSTGGVNSVMGVYDATRTLDYDRDDNDFASYMGGSASNVAGTPTTGGTTYVAVGTQGGSDTDSGRIYAVVQPPLDSASAEAEPNGTIEVANSSAANYFTGTVTDINDLDVFRFEAGAGTRVYLGLDADPTRLGTPFNPRIDLIGPTGTVIIAANDANSTSDTTPAIDRNSQTPTSPGEALVYEIAESGTYYARVRSIAGAQTGDYLLSIALDCQTGVSPVITETSLPDGAVGTPYSQTLHATNTVGATSYALAGGALPPGLTLSADGTISGTPTTAGTHPFAVEVTDSRGLKFTRSFSVAITGGAGPTGPSGPTGPGPGPGPSGPGGPTGPGTAKPPPVATRDRVAPRVTGFRVTNKTFAAARASAKPKAKKGTKLSFRLSEPAKVSVLISLKAAGRRVGRRCVAATKARAKRPKCTRLINKGTLSFTGRAGANSITFTGRVKRRKLAAGAYQATLVATDAAGNRSRPATARFRIVRR